jgi:hypothetical protein
VDLGGCFALSAQRQKLLMQVALAFGAGAQRILHGLELGRLLAEFRQLVLEHSKLSGMRSARLSELGFEGSQAQFPLFQLQRERRHLLDTLKQRDELRFFACEGRLHFIQLGGEISGKRR